MDDVVKLKKTIQCIVDSKRYIINHQMTELRQKEGMLQMVSNILDKDLSTEDLLAALVERAINP